MNHNFRLLGWLYRFVVPERSSPPFSTFKLNESEESVRHLKRATAITKITEAIDLILWYFNLLFIE